MRKENKCFDRVQADKQYLPSILCSTLKCLPTKLTYVLRSPERAAEVASFPLVMKWTHTSHSPGPVRAQTSRALPRHARWTMKVGTLSGAKSRNAQPEGWPSQTTLTHPCLSSSAASSTIGRGYIRILWLLRLLLTPESPLSPGHDGQAQEEFAEAAGPQEGTIAAERPCAQRASRLTLSTE